MRISSFEKAALLPKRYKIQLAVLLFLVLDQSVNPPAPPPLPPFEISQNTLAIERKKSASQLLWLEMVLFSKKALHNIEKH